MESVPAGDNADKSLPETVLDFQYLDFSVTPRTLCLCGDKSPLCLPPPLCPHPSRANWPRISIACSIRADHE
jgi:hypothetical protein